MATGADGPLATVWVLGAGGHGKVLVSTLLAAGDRVAVADDDPALEGQRLLGVEVVRAGPAAPPHGARVVLGIGSNEVRRRFDEELSERVQWAVAVHPAAWVDSSVLLDGGAVVFAGAVVQPDARIGRHAVVNTGASVDHDGVIGDYAFVGPGARLAGDVVVGQGAFVGTGASILPGRRVGAWATVGAGAVVVRDVEEGMTVVGNPARPVR